MDRDNEDSDDCAQCIPDDSRPRFTIGENMASSSDTIVFDTKLMKTSTQAEELAATWGGRCSLPDSSRLRRAHSWSGGPPDDVASKIRILRERLVRTQTKLRPGAIRHFTHSQRLTLFSLALVDFMSFCSMSIMAPFFPREATEKGLSNTMCGIVFSFYAVIMFITSPLFGKFLPRIGVKFMFTAGLFMAGSCNVIFGSLALIQDPTTFLVLCFIVRGLEALGASAYSTASYVYVVNVFPDTIGSVLGILETFVGLGMSVGPAIGGLLYSVDRGIWVTILQSRCRYGFDCAHKYDISTRLRRVRVWFKNGINITIGLIFLLLSSLYGVFSPIWGWVADRVHNHWCMMVWGLFLSTLGLLLLGPCPFIPGLPKDLWLDLVALSILGMSVALTLLPTFQGVLTSSIYEGGCPEAIATYSAVAGVWSCCYSLGEVLGPALGGALAERYGFPFCATLCAAACFTMGVVTLTFFSLRETSKWIDEVDSITDSIPYTDSTWNSNNFCRSRSAPPCQYAEHTPLISPTPSCYKSGPPKYGTTSQKICLLHSKSKKSGSASVAEILEYILKFQFLTNIYIKIWRLKNRHKSKPIQSDELYQNYFAPENVNCDNTLKEPKPTVNEGTHINNNNGNAPDEDSYCSFIDNAIFGPASKTNNGLIMKRNNAGLVVRLANNQEEARSTDEIIKHNLQKVLFYEQNNPCLLTDDIFNGCECKDGITFVRGTVTVSSTGACEV
ncbi:unnamed protein product [Colias eurytheme]|nr:unnamed protein product [Colias eurytheme]